MTNLEKIRNRSLEETATYILRHDDLLLDEICNAQGSCPYGDDVELANCTECIKRWLKQDVNEGGRFNAEIKKDQAATDSGEH